MNEFSLGAAAWLWDYYLLASALLTAVLVASAVVRQPVRRRAIAWSTVLGLLALALLCAWPQWGRFHLTPMPSAPAPPTVSQPKVFKPEFGVGTVVPTIIIQPEEDPRLLLEPEVVVSIDYERIALGSFVAGSGLVLVWLMLGSWQVRRLCASATRPPSHVVELLSALAGPAATSPSLGIVDLHVPVAVGLWRPVILLPESLAKTSAPEAIRTILAHELAHVRHGDLWQLAALRGLLVVLWAHPLFWLLRRRVRLDQELLADAAAAEASSRHDYADQLVRLARSTAAVRPPRLVSSVGLWEGPSQLKRRIALLLDEKLAVWRSCSRRWRAASIALITLATLALSLVTLQPESTAVAQTKADTPESSSTEDAVPKPVVKPTVRIVAIGTNSEQPVKWWSEKGAPIDPPALALISLDSVSPTPNRQIIFAVEGFTDDADVTWQTLPASNTASKRVISGDPEDRAKYYGHIFDMKGDAKTFELRVRIAAGEWKTVVSGLNSSHGLPEEKSAIFSKPLIDPQGNVLVIVSHNFYESKSRVIGIDQNGERHIAEPSGAYGAGPLNQSFWRFPGLLPSDLKTCKLQTRPYEWVEFKDLPASPLQRAVRKEAELPWSVHGRITDADGNGLVDVEVRAATGYGTLVGGGSTKTDRDGRYRLAFGPGMAMKRSEEAPLGVGVQAASIFAGKPGWFEANLCRQGNLLMTDLTPETIDNEHKRWGHKTLETVVFPDQPKDVNFVMKPAAVIEGVLYEQGKGVVVADQAISVVGEQLPPSSSELMNVFTGRDGRFLIADLPTEFEWKFAIRIPNSILQLKTEPIRFNEPGKYRCRLILESSSGEDKGVAIRLRIAKMERADEPESGTPPIDHIFQPETPTVRRR